MRGLAVFYPVCTVTPATPHSLKDLPNIVIYTAREYPLLEAKRAAELCLHQSRGVVIERDEEKMSADLLSEYTSPEKLLSTSQGNMQYLPNASVFIGWGSEFFAFEFPMTARYSLKLTCDSATSPTGPFASHGALIPPRSPL